MKDYGLRLGKAYESLGLAASELVAVFLTGSDGSATVTPMVTKDSFTALPKPTIISLTGWTAASSHRIALFNSLSKRRQELVSLLVDSDAVKVRTSGHRRMTSPWPLPATWLAAVSHLHSP